jgi:FAD/FMN-containing dehydrogenase
MTDGAEWTTTLESWGRYPKTRSIARPLHWADEPLPIGAGDRVLPYGNGRSYGDSCLNDDGVLLCTRELRRLRSFDRQSGVMRIEAGALLSEILELAVPAGWFLPVTPGTKFVTIGGAVANDIHGKNHHVAGCFGSHVLRFELLRSTGERLVCSPSENADKFAATIGGLGLTGVITWVELQLLKIDGPFIETDNVALHSLDDFFSVSAESAHWPYTVGWIDSVARGSRLGRGVFFRGRHTTGAGAPKKQLLGGALKVPFTLPPHLLNRFTIRAFNTVVGTVWRSQAGRPGRAHYEPFFYPLDAVGSWNRVYGPGGLMQYQAVVPHEEKHAIHDLLDQVARASGSFLTVLKIFGDIPSPGIMSFPRPGITLNLDFPFDGPSTLALCDRLDAVVRAANGALYPAKDARMPVDMFERSFPRLKEFLPHIDPRFSSSFWRRVHG